jgi:hypothetical protein
MSVKTVRSNNQPLGNDSIRNAAFSLEMLEAPAYSVTRFQRQNQSLREHDAEVPRRQFHTRGDGQPGGVRPTRSVGWFWSQV